MELGPTVITRFRNEVAAALRERDAVGAAQRTWSAAAIFEPGGRAGRVGDEQERLVLLADRAARRWTPLAIGVLGEHGLNELARQLPAVLDYRSAAIAAGHVGRLRELLRAVPEGRGAAKAQDVASVLASLEKSLQAIGDGDPARPEDTAITAVPHAARGLVDCLYVGAAFDDGLPGEMRATVVILDAIDRTRTISRGAREQERTASESNLHRTLVRSLMSTLAINHGQITHADDGGALPRPFDIGRHRPDLAGLDAIGGLFIGEAKLGPELLAEHTQEQLADFLGYAPDGIAVPLHLIVPRGWRGHAERAAQQARPAGTEQLVVYEVGGLPDAPTPFGGGVRVGRL